MTRTNCFEAPRSVYPARDFPSRQDLAIRLAKCTLLTILMLSFGCQPKASSPAGIPAGIQGKSDPPAAARSGKSKVAAIIQNDSGDDSDANSASPQAVTPAAAESKKPRAKKLKPALRVLDAPPRPLFEPTVVMTEAHRRTCLVGVGDALPPLVAQKQDMSELFGEKLTILVFWDHRHVFALDQFLRLQEEVAAVFDGTGVQVIAINVGDEPDAVAATYQRSGGGFLCLVDPRGEAFTKVATEKLPRTYVVDPTGQILWMDIEYSYSMRRELDNAVRFFLQPPGDQKTL